MKITIKQLSGKTFEVEGQPEMTVMDLKKVVSTQSGFEAELQRLIFKGRVLKDADTLEKIGVADGAKIILVKGNKRRAAEKQAEAAAASAPAAPTGAPAAPVGASAAPSGAVP